MKKLILSLALLTLSATFTIYYYSVVKSPKVAYATHISCYCDPVQSSICAANTGSQNASCAGGDNMKCWEYDGNCRGTTGTTEVEKDPVINP